MEHEAFVVVERGPKFDDGTWGTGNIVHVSGHESTFAAALKGDEFCKSQADLNLKCVGIHKNGSSYEDRDKMEWMRYRWWKA